MFCEANLSARGSEAIFYHSCTQIGNIFSVTSVVDRSVGICLFGLQLVNKFNFVHGYIFTLSKSLLNTNAIFHILFPSMWWTLLKFT